MVSNGTEARIQPRCDELAARILDGAKVAGWKIAAAESLTGGLLADAFVRIPGASDVFLGSAVTYDINAKASVLGVDGDLLAQEGAVHPEVARQMALCTSRLYRQPQYGDKVLGLSTTGVAGPGPDGDKPAGLVYIGISVPANSDMDTRRTVAAELRLFGSREEVRRLTVLNILRFVTQLTTLTEE
ncbi:nicotinamide-nucleotide amidohydrolase family protein [Bifidobacterium sp. ESL0784]|uniref:CinA family protein n=1 Tax=Bifidobacterium sp. ESL0784 TaxID=2983231 RepID=UPI0023F90D8E|nr:nicotinamide-nucleotide amidohydrolase family protein [Bifidobacterium sp. ESL0784]MDF7641128.1 nicotinamide-nucleotide amidohydrolase family protein [Bifidobacterium sp. ESL0784]